MYSHEDASLTELAEIQFSARTDQLKRVRSVVRQTLEQQGCGAECSLQLVLALDEAITNVIRHAYQGDESGDISLLIAREGDDLVFSLRDYAQRIDPSQVRSRDLDDVRPGGLGVHFIVETMDETTFLDPADGEGNLLVMRKRIPIQQDAP